MHTTDEGAQQSIPWALPGDTHARAAPRRTTMSGTPHAQLSDDLTQQGDLSKGGAVRSPAAGDLDRPIPATVVSDPLGKAIARHITHSAPARGGVALLQRMLKPARVRLSQHDVQVQHLPRSLDGLRILHVTDLHLHPGFQPAWQLPAIAAAVPHDLLCYTGDFIDSDDDFPRLAHFLDQMPHSAPTYAVLGNHDHTPYGRGKGANDVVRLQSTLAAAGVQVLTNAAHALFDGRLYLAGVDDPSTGRDDMNRAMTGISENACTVLLAHSPDVVLRLGARRPGMILAGHTHGGQVRLPFVGAVLTQSRLPRRLAAGLHRYRGVQLFVSRGAGYSWIDVRIGCPPEAALLTLRTPLQQDTAWQAESLLEEPAV